LASFPKQRKKSKEKKAKKRKEKKGIAKQFFKKVNG